MYGIYSLHNRPLNIYKSLQQPFKKLNNTFKSSILSVETYLSSLPNEYLDLYVISLLYKQAYFIELNLAVELQCSLGMVHDFNYSVETILFDLRATSVMFVNLAVC